ncbi:alpha/beta fold hydrolase [Pseudomonas sp. ES3-33]|uniref:alpha/beta fold hydrolase n=1 Tax=Pseudomonas sp. ES3-33 TaxID=1628833 RepID=UPI001F23C9E6|nr:hypothetical protein [Pseudomonas sp. ES3-33]
MIGVLVHDCHLSYVQQGKTMATHKLTIKDLQVNVSIYGKGSPLLLLNGQGGLIRTFDSLRDELVDFTTITLDVPGVGKSQMPRWPMRLPRYADLVAEMLKQLPARRLGRLDKPAADCPSAPAHADPHRRYALDLAMVT